MIKTLLRRRAWLASPGLLLLDPTARLAQAASSGDLDPDAVRRGRRLAFPRDHGAHPAQRIEWWYVTGWLADPAAGDDATHGFQVTFFRVRTRLGEGLKSRFAPRQLLMAHAAITDLRAQRHVHAQRLVRWSGDDGVEGRDHARLDDAGVRVGGWRFDRRDEAGASTWLASIDAGDWSLDVRMRATQPLLLHGDAGYFVKALVDGRETASHYVSDPQLAVRMRLRLPGRESELEGAAWLDHEWAETLVPEDAAGWDWVGMNLDDGAALMAYRMRRPDGSVLGANGSFRDARGALQAFAPDALRFTPGRVWQSPATGGRYPVVWTIDTPVGRFEVRSLLDAQELDARASTGTVYWEGLSTLHDAQGRRVGRGYLEMTGYVGRLRF
jgi:predicted secreted hydrolase